jgi:hypothetical protein
VMHGVDVNGGNWESRRASSVAESGECGSESGMGCQRRKGNGHSGMPASRSSSAYS